MRAQVYTAAPLQLQMCANSKKEAGSRPEQIPRFRTESMPPGVPDSPFFSCERTSIALVVKPGIVASVMGDALLSILDDLAQADKEGGERRI